MLVRKMSLPSGLFAPPPYDPFNETMSYLCVCVSVCEVLATVNGSFGADHSCDIISQEFRQTAGLETAQGRLCAASPSVSLPLFFESSFAFCCGCALCREHACERCLRRDPDVTSHPVRRVGEQLLSIRGTERPQKSAAKTIPPVRYAAIIQSSARYITSLTRRGSLFSAARFGVFC